MKEDKTELQKYFESQGIRQNQVAAKLGRGVAYVNDLIRGRKRFGRQTAAQWSALFGFREEWLLTGNGEMMKDGSYKATNSLSVHGVTMHGSQHVNTAQTENGDVSFNKPDADTIAMLKDAMDMNRTLVATLTDTIAEQRRSNERMLKLYEEMREMQNRHNEASRKYLDENIELIQRLRAEVFEKVDKLGMLINDGFEASTTKIIGDCKTFDLIAYNESLKKMGA